MYVCMSHYIVCVITNIQLCVSIINTITHDMLGTHKIIIDHLQNCYTLSNTSYTIRILQIFYFGTPLHDKDILSTFWLDLHYASYTIHILLHILG